MGRTMTDEEIQRAMEMQGMGYGPARIAAELGRHKRTIQYILRKRTMTKEQNDRQNFLRNQARRNRRELAGPRAFFVASDGTGTAGVVVAAKPTPDMIAERDRRFSRPFTIAHDLMGDPEPGRSALDQREARA